MRYRDQHFTSLQEYIAHQDRGKLADTNSTPLYAHPVDKWIVSTLNAAPVKTLMTKAFDAYVSIGLGRELADAINIDQKSFADLFDILSHCARTLDIPVPHAVAIHREGQLLNAYTTGTDDYAFIVISSTLCHIFTKEEACFVIGHECGHIASSHMLYHALVGMLTHAAVSRLIPASELLGLLRFTASVPLLAWSRRSEITADRAGLLCCGDIAIAERALLRLVTGLADPNNVDIEHYLRGTEEAEQMHRISGLHEFFATHPLIPKRIKALRLFSNSELYYSLTGKTRPISKTLLSQEELNRRVEQIVKP